MRLSDKMRDAKNSPDGGATSRMAKSSGRNATRKSEVKLRVADREALLRNLARLQAQPTRARVHEMNTLYDTPDGALARKGKLLRIRVERPADRGRSAKDRARTRTKRDADL